MPVSARIRDLITKSQSEDAAVSWPATEQAQRSRTIYTASGAADRALEARAGVRWSK